MRQVHGARVLEAESAPSDPVGDACIARSPERPCAVLSADCLPVLLCAASGTIVAAAHAGWRGLAAGVIENTVAGMRTRPAELLAWLGPAIGASAYEVGSEVRGAFVRRHREDADAFVPSGPGRWTADLARLARARLRRCGVSAVHGGDLCTHSDPGRFLLVSTRRPHGAHCDADMDHGDPGRPGEVAGFRLESPRPAQMLSDIIDSRIPQCGWIG